MFDVDTWANSICPTRDIHLPRDVKYAIVDQKDADISGHIYGEKKEKFDQCVHDKHARYDQPTCYPTGQHRSVR